MHVDGVSYGLIPEVSPTNTVVTETVKKVYKVETDEQPVEKPTKTTTSKPTKTTTTKSAKSTKTT